MRDIRGELQERANLFEEQINAHQSQFDTLIDQLKREHDQRLKDLKTELEAVNRLLDFELRRFSSAPAAPTVQTPDAHAVHQPAQQSAPQPPQHSAYQPGQHSSHGAQPHPQPQTQPKQPLADFLVSKMNEVGAVSRDDLQRLALQEGYFADADTAVRGMHNTLLNMVKSGLIRQLPNGDFAPANIQLRRAM
jgi:hypothetical protein